MTEKIFTLKNSDISIILNHFEDSKNRDYVVLMLHGFPSGKNSTTNRNLCERFNNKKISNCRFDFYGCYDNTSPVEDITLTKCVDESLIVINHLIEKFNLNKFVIVGSSFGGQIAELLANRCDKVVCGIVLKAPASNYFIQLNNEKIDLLEWKKNGFIEYEGSQIIKLKYSFYEDVEKYNFEKELKEINCPVRIVHGNCDDVVNLEEQSIYADNLIKDSQLLIINGADHYFSKDSHKQLCFDLMEMFTCEIIENDKRK